MITNPATGHVQRDLQIAMEEDRDVMDRSTPIAVKRVQYVDPDTELDKMFETVSTRIVDVDAKLMEPLSRKPGQFEQKHYRSLLELRQSPTIRRRVLDLMSATQLKDLNVRLQESFTRDKEFGKRLQESNFYLGMYPDEEARVTNTSSTVFPITDTVLPGFNGPSSKQQLWADYSDMHRKAWEAGTRNPVGKRICLAGETLIPLLDGSDVAIADLAASGTSFWIYACRDGMVVPAEATAHFTGTRMTYDVQLDNGAGVRATADHPFMLRDGSYREVQDLRPGDSLMPLYRKVVRGYEQTYHPDLGLWEYTHRMVARNVHRAEFRAKPVLKGGGQVHIHHVDDNSRNNLPSNLTYLSQREHVTLTSQKEKNKAIKRALPQSVNFGARIKKLWADPEWRARQQEKFKQAMPARRASLSEKAKENWQRHRQRYLEGMAERPLQPIDPATGRFVKKAANNHKVLSVTPVGEMQVFDLHVPGFHNFAVSAGVFVHNCDIIPQFVLGRGVVGTIRNPTHQQEWDDFYRLNKMRSRLRQILRELLMYGEIFNRFFKRPEGVVLRQVDPSTIWDIITDPEDIEQVYYYHQQYTIMHISSVPLPARLQPTRLIIRQIPAKEIDHFKINCTTSEKRGRSQLYCILGWLLRLKEFANDRVLLNKMRAMFALDVAVEGDAQAVSRIEQQFARPIGAGAVLVHNKATEVEFKNANNNANEAKTDAEMILKIIAVGAGVSEQFLGVSESTTRAGALIQTEPDVKNFETYQEIVEDILVACYERVVVGRKLSSSRNRMEFTFPALAQEDRSTKIKDIAFAEAMNWFSIQRCATMAAKEFGISTYEYRTERAEIDKENETEQVIATGMQQVPKVEELPPEAPGMGGDMAPGEEVPGEGPEGPPGLADQEQPVVHTSGQMGFSAKQLSGRGVADTQATLDRSNFSRGKERESILKRKSAGAPIRASAFPATYGDLARASSLYTRRQQRIARLTEALLTVTQPRMQQRLTRELEETKGKLAETLKELDRLRTKS